MLLFLNMRTDKNKNNLINKQENKYSSINDYFI